MLSLSQHRAPVLHAPLLILAALLQVVVWAAHPGTASAQDQAAPNIIVTSDETAIRPQGAFQRINTRMSRSRQPLRSAGPGPNRVTFTASITEPGYYRVFVWWPQVYDDSVGNADVLVRHSQGNSTVTMDQRQRSGQWIPVGIFEFGPSGARIDLVGRPGSTLLADAVRLQYLGRQMPPLALETDALPVALTGEQYGAWFDVIGGSPPFTFAADPRRLPAGVALDAASGTLTGTAIAVGSYQFEMEVFDHSGQRAQRTYTIDVIRGSDASMGKRATVIYPTNMTTNDGVPAGAPPDLSNLISLLAGLPEGEWARANLNVYSDVWTPDALRPLFGLSNPNPGRIISAWSSFAWDPNRGDLWLFGGGHANYPGNDVYRWRGTSRMWARASLPSEVKQDDLGNWQAIDGWDAAPASAHTYDNNMFFPHIDRFVVFGGAAYNSGGPWKREVTPTTNRLTGPFFFDPSRADSNKVGGTTGSHVMRVSPYPTVVGGSMWANRDIYVNIPGNPPLLGAQINGCTAYGDENGKDVAYIGAQAPGGSSQLNLYKYTVNSIASPSLDTFQKIGIFWNGTAGRTACGVDPARRVLVRIGDQGIPFVYWNLATPGLNNKDVRVTPVDPTGEFGSLLSSSQITLQACALDFDPMRARFVLWCGDGRVWVLTPPPTVSPSGWTIAKQPSPTLATPNGSVGTGLLGKWKYISNIDAFIGLQDSTLGNIWIYKPIGWINPLGSTSPPTGVTASDGTSTSSVAITWNASANATSYTTYRSTTSGVQGTAIGSTTATNFTDTSPAPGTIYYYGVTATGPAGTSSLSAQDSGFAAVVVGGGSLSGTAALTSVVNLTAIGTTDWVHWLPLNRKATGGFISDYAPVATTTITAYFNDPRSFTWTNGTPIASGNDSSGATTSGIGAGFSFTVAADTTPRKLLVYVGGTNSTGKLTAHLSDASAADFVDTSLAGSGIYDGLYTLTFRAGSAGKQLQVTWTQAAGTGGISLQAVALQ